MTLLLTPVSPMTLGEPWTAHTFSLLGSSTGTSPHPAKVKYEEVDRIMEERSYHYRDFITLNKEALGETLESMLDGFYKEHMHEFEEARYILTGHGYWDIREHPTEVWVRFKVGPGDLVILPPGMFRRFTLDEKTDLSAIRMFLETPSRHTLPRDKIADTNPYRIDYLRSIATH